MNKDKIIELVTLYIHDYCSRASINNLSKQEVLLIECDGSWALELTGLSGDKIKKRIKLPELSGNESISQMKVAYHLINSINNYFARVKSVRSRTKEQLSDSARKAVNARWAKYREKMDLEQNKNSND